VVFNQFQNVARLTSLMMTGKFPFGKIINSRVEVSQIIEPGLEKLTAKSNKARKILVRSGKQTPAQVIEPARFIIWRDRRFKS
jgi:hypothetical protein